MKTIKLMLSVILIFNIGFFIRILRFKDYPVRDIAILPPAPRPNISFDWEYAPNTVQVARIAYSTDGGTNWTPFVEIQGAKEDGHVYINYIMPDHLRWTKMRP